MYTTYLNACDMWYIICYLILYLKFCIILYSVLKRELIYKNKKGKIKHILKGKTAN